MAEFKNMLHARPMGEESLPRHHATVGQSDCQQTSLEGGARDQNRSDLGRAAYGPVNRTMHFYYLRGAAVSLICRVADYRQIDLIVTGTAYRPGVTESLLSNTSESVMNQVDCSVLSVKPDNFDSPITA